MFAFLSLWFLYVKEFGKKIDILRESWCLLAGSRWFLKYHIISISLRFSFSASLVQGRLKVTCYLSFPLLLYFRESGTRSSQKLISRVVSPQAFYAFLKWLSVSLPHHLGKSGARPEPRVTRSLLLVSASLPRGTKLCLYTFSLVRGVVVGEVIANINFLLIWFPIINSTPSP